MWKKSLWIDLRLPEPPNKIANDLSSYLAFTLQSLPPFTGFCPTILPNNSFPIISPSDVINKILKLRKLSSCPLDILIDLIKAFSDKIAEYLSNILNQITKFAQVAGNKVLLHLSQKIFRIWLSQTLRPITLTPVFS